MKLTHQTALGTLGAAGAETARPSLARGGRAFRIAALAAGLLAAGIVPFMLFGARTEAWAAGILADARALGWTAQALAVFLLASDVLLPVPSSLVSVACGAAWGLGAGSLISALGMTLGSCLGYALGRWAGDAGLRRWAGDAPRERVERLHARYGPWIVALLRPVPVLAEASSVVAGYGRWPWWRYFALSAAANLVVSLAYCGAVAALRGALAG